MTKDELIQQLKSIKDEFYRNRLMSVEEFNRIASTVNKISALIARLEKEDFKCH